MYRYKCLIFSTLVEAGKRRCQSRVLQERVMCTVRKCIGFESECWFSSEVLLHSASSECQFDMLQFSFCLLFASTSD